MAETPRKGTPTGHEEPLTVVKIDEKASSQSLGPRDPASQDSAREESPYTTLRNKEKIFTIILASFAAFILPISSSIYLPALNALAKELNVTSSRNKYHYYGIYIDPGSGPDVYWEHLR